MSLAKTPFLHAELRVGNMIGNRKRRPEQNGTPHIIKVTHEDHEESKPSKGGPGARSAGF